MALSKLNARASHGTGNKGSLSQFNQRASHGTGNKGTTASLVAGTHRTGKTAFPSMARGPVRAKAGRAGIG
jgi:hypothetical protein